MRLPQVFACSLPANDLVGLKEMFHAIDTDNSGTISVQELQEGLRKKGSHMAEAVSAWAWEQGRPCSQA